MESSPKVLKIPNPPKIVKVAKSLPVNKNQMVFHHRVHCKKVFASANASAQQDNYFAEDSLK